ncbi:hypothetical protein ACTD5D_31450 [Nocardia takedensis]|uniref:hypothetical protein n=1 Tax=Nocardia takedensis TaxID=259390 RepID=UPI003F757F72
MSENERQRRGRERAELEAEFARLDTAYGVLSDMLGAAGAAAMARDFRGVEVEMERLRSTDAVTEQVYAERCAVWDRLLDYRFPPEAAAGIRAQLREHDREVEQRLRARGVERSR